MVPIIGRNSLNQSPLSWFQLETRQPRGCRHWRKQRSPPRLEHVQRGEIRSVIVRAKAAVRKFKLLNLCVLSADETEADPAHKTTGCCSEGRASCQINLRQLQNIHSAGLLWFGVRVLRRWNLFYLRAAFHSPSFLRLYLDVEVIS